MEEEIERERNSYDQFRMVFFSSKDFKCIKAGEPSIIRATKQKPLRCQSEKKSFLQRKSDGKELYKYTKRVRKKEKKSKQQNQLKKNQK